MKLPILRSALSAISSRPRTISTFHSSSSLLKVKGHQIPLLQQQRGLKLRWLLGPPPKTGSRDYYKRTGFYVALYFIAFFSYKVSVEELQFSGYLVPDHYHVPHLVGKVDYPIKVHFFTAAELEIARAHQAKMVEMFEKGEMVKPEEKE